MVRRDPVLIAWVIGLALAGLVFVVGPDQFLFRLSDTMHVLAWRIVEAFEELSATALDAVRALSIGLYVTFMALSFAVLRRGGRARAAMVVVTLLYCLLVGAAAPGDQVRWLAALVLSGAGAAVMTGRLRQARVPAQA
jgi:uncharacterized membrane protein YjdF